MEHFGVLKYKIHRKMVRSENINGNQHKSNLYLVTLHVSDQSFIHRLLLYIYLFFFSSLSLCLRLCVCVFVCLCLRLCLSFPHGRTLFSHFLFRSLHSSLSLRLSISSSLTSFALLLFFFFFTYSYLLDILFLLVS